MKFAVFPVSVTLIFGIWMGFLVAFHTYIVHESRMGVKSYVPTGARKLKERRRESK